MALDPELAADVASAAAQILAREIGAVRVDTPGPK
jgi:hypothetical protein